MLLSCSRGIHVLKTNPPLVYSTVARVVNIGFGGGERQSTFVAMEMGMDYDG